MPLGGIAGELLGAIFRFVGQFLIEAVLEFAVKGLGYLICRIFTKSPDPDGAIVTIVGMLAWIAFISLCIISYRWML